MARKEAERKGEREARLKDEVGAASSVLWLVHRDR